MPAPVSDENPAVDLYDATGAPRARGVLVPQQRVAFMGWPRDLTTQIALRPLEPTANEVEPQWLEAAAVEIVEFAGLADGVVALVHVTGPVPGPITDRPNLDESAAEALLTAPNATLSNTLAELGVTEFNSVASKKAPLPVPPPPPTALYSPAITTRQVDDPQVMAGFLCWIFRWD